MVCRAAVIRAGAPKIFTICNILGWWELPRLARSLLKLLVLLMLLMVGRVLPCLSLAPAALSGHQQCPQAAEHIKDVFESQCHQWI